MERNIETVTEVSPNVNLTNNKSIHIDPETHPVASGPNSDTNNLEDVIRAVLRKKVADNPLWSDEQKQQISNRLIELYDQETEKSKKEALLKPTDPDVEKKKAVDALVEETNKQMLATVECRKNIPPQCVEHLTRMARLECTYYKQAGTGPGVKERMEAAKQKYREENRETIVKEMERNKLFAQQIEADTKKITEDFQALEAKQCNLRKIIDIRATQRKSIQSQRMFLNPVEEKPSGLPVPDNKPVCDDIGDNIVASNIK